MKRHSKKMDIAALLKNKNVLYVVLFLAIMNLFSYLMLKKLDAVAFFIIIGGLTTYFSKNMIIVLLTSMLSTFLLVQINLLGQVQEGMEDKNTTPESETTEPSEEDTKTIPTVTKPAPTIPLSISPTGPPAPVSGTAPIVNRPTAASSVTTPAKVKTEGFKKEKFSQNLSPARYNAEDDDDMPRHKPKIDYASTLESAYDNLDKLLSSDAIKSMTDDTGRLAEKQKLLMGSIEKMTPVMEKAGSILQSFDMGAITKLMESVGGSASNLKKGFKTTGGAEAE